MAKLFLCSCGYSGISGKVFIRSRNYHFIIEKQAMNPFRTGQLVMFQVHYDRDWHFFEVVFFIVIGIFGGLYGEFVIKWNLRAQAFRKRFLTKYALAEATFLAGMTAVICYFNMFLRIDMTESMEILFRECEGGHDYNGLCQYVSPHRISRGGGGFTDEWCRHNRRWRMIFSLTMATVIRIFLVIISYGCKVPAGIFVPSMAIGASFGRTVGILVQALHEASPNSHFFASCKPDIPCITPGTYAFLGAAAALSGIMHITVSVVVIMFELTGALTYILPTMIVVGVTKAVSDRFGKGGIADRMIWFNGFPFLDNKEEHSFGVPVSQVMNEDLTVLPVSGMTVEEIGIYLKLPHCYRVLTHSLRTNTQKHIISGLPHRTGSLVAADRGLYKPRRAEVWNRASKAGTYGTRNGPMLLYALPSRPAATYPLSSINCWFRFLCQRRVVGRFRALHRPDAIDSSSQTAAGNRDGDLQEGWAKGGAGGAPGEAVRDRDPQRRAAVPVQDGEPRASPERG